MKRILPLILAAAMTLTAGTAALADNVSDALEKAATMTNDELYAKAQEEMAAGAQLNFYSTTSFAEKAAANFMRAYPALDGKVVYAEIDDGESYTILTNTIGSGVKDSADMALTQNGADLKTYLLDDGLSYAYFPKALESVVAEQYREPAVVTFVNSLLIYNNTAGSVGLTNVWELTEAKWKDKVFFKDPTNETVNINFLIMLTSPEWNEKLEKAYESYYGKAWEKGEFESAAYEWIAGFLSNVNYTYTSASKMATGIASGAAGNMGLFVFSKLRKVDEADRGKLTVVQFENDVDGFSGFMYPMYAMISANATRPYTAMLFIEYLMTQEGFQPWGKSIGAYSTSTAVTPNEGDLDITVWKDTLVMEDPEYILDNFDDVSTFAIKYIQK